MGDKHPLTKADIEKDTAQEEKLNAFRERAKQMKRDSPVHRVYATFDTLAEFTTKAQYSVAELSRHLEKGAPSPQPQSTDPTPTDPVIPTPPAFYAEPPYIGSHQFVDRKP